MSGKWRWLTGTALMLSISLATVPLPAQSRPAAPPNEYQVKAVFLYNFTKFVEWPAASFSGPAAPIVIGIVGRDPFEDKLIDTTRGERVNGREIVIRQFGPRDPIRGCHILFIGLTDRRKVADVLTQVQGLGRSVLTVSDADDFAVAGGVIGMTKDDFRVGLEINLQAAEHASLKISSRLLSLARIVDPSARGPRP